MRRFAFYQVKGHRLLNRCVTVIITHVHTFSSIQSYIEAIEHKGNEYHDLRLARNRPWRYDVLVASSLKLDLCTSSLF